MFTFGKGFVFNPFNTTALTKNRQKNQNVKKLSLSLPSSTFSLQNANITTDDFTKKIFRSNLVKKITSITLQPSALAEFTPRLRNNLRKLTIVPSRGGFTFMDYNWNEKQIVRDLKCLKHLKKLTISEPLLWRYFKAVRTIPSLRDIHIKIYETDIPQAYKLFSGVENLNIVQISIEEYSDDNLPIFPKQIELTWRFLKDLTRIKNLKALRLRIRHCVIAQNPYFCSRLLAMLASSNIEKLDLVLHIRNIQYNEEMNEMLSKVDELFIQSYKYSTEDLPPHSSTNAQKRIRIHFYPSYKNDITSLITNSPNLKFLTIWDENGDLSLSESESSLVIPKLEALHLTTNYHDNQKQFKLLSFLLKNFDLLQLKTLHLNIKRLTENNIAEILKIHSLISSDAIREYELQTFDTSRGFDTREEADDPDSRVLPSCDSFCRLCESLSKFTVLQKFKLATRFGDSLPTKYLDNSLQNMKNLTKLSLKFYGEDWEKQVILPLRLSLGTLSKLNTVELLFSPHFKLDYMELVEGMSKLENLERLTIDYNELKSKHAESKEKIESIFNKFPKMQKIISFSN